MNEKKKLKFNFLDVIIIIALVIAVFFGVKYINESVFSSEDTEKKCEYILNVENLKNDFALCINEGDIIYDYISGAELGMVKKATVFYENSEKSQDSSEYCHIELVIECEGKISENANGEKTVKTNGAEIKSGTEIKSKNSRLYFKAKCNI